MSTTTITVTGMTCEHCASSVREEIGEIPGVTAVNVDLESGRIGIESSTELDSAAITAAVDEAGYKIVD